jgi:hypothetical protein
MDVVIKFARDNARRCPGYAKTLVKLQMELFRYKAALEPFDRTTASLGLIWLKVESFIKYLHTLNETSTSECDKKCYECAGMVEKVADEFVARVARSKVDVPGLCLQCERAGELKLGEDCGHIFDK